VNCLRWANSHRNCRARIRSFRSSVNVKRAVPRETCENKEEVERTVEEYLHCIPPPRWTYAGPLRNWSDSFAWLIRMQQGQGQARRQRDFLVPMMTQHLLF